MSADVYNTEYWSDGYFGVTEGDLTVKSDQGQCSMKSVVKALADAGVHFPVLVRFDHILRDRVQQLCNAFAKAKAHEHYRGEYVCVYPIKVNQQRWVVESLLAAHDPSQGYVLGLEAGSKPELIACLALMKPAPSVLICNGYKDREYIRLALAGLKLGLDVFIVIEKIDEVNIIIEEALQIGVRPKIGLRARLDSIGAGQWQNTGGEKSKFGLNARKILQATDMLLQANMLDCLSLLHFHMGSQVSSAMDIAQCVSEAANIWANVRALGAPLAWLDVGGGLGVDYEGTRSRSTFSINYSVTEYASVIVHAIRRVCDVQEVPHPNIITESGRHLTAHHACLLAPVLGIESPVDRLVPEPPDQISGSLHDLWQCFQQLQAGPPVRALVELFHQIDYAFQDIKKRFPLGGMSIYEKAHAENLYLAALSSLRTLLDPQVKNHKIILDEINSRLAEKLFLNFSIFQSIPDKWGIAQIFPVMPIQNINQVTGVRRGRIQDITCDSDGQIDHYVDGMGIETTFPMPDSLKSGDILAIFLVGAYQEILGDMHNLFGDTSAANVQINGDDSVTILSLNRGDSVEDVLKYVKYDVSLLTSQLQSQCELADLPEESRARFEGWLLESLRSSVYLQ